MAITLGIAITGVGPDSAGGHRLSAERELSTPRRRLPVAAIRQMNRTIYQALKAERAISHKRVSCDATLDLRYLQRMSFTEPIGLIGRNRARVPNFVMQKRY
jgi:hypothetical protein